jgi:hypothetical protein
MFLYVVPLQLCCPPWRYNLDYLHHQELLDNVITPILVWVISLMSLHGIHLYFHRTELFGSILSGILMWKVVYNWLLFIGRKISRTENS